MLLVRCSMIEGINLYFVQDYFYLYKLLTKSTSTGLLDDEFGGVLSNYLDTGCHSEICI